MLVGFNEKIIGIYIEVKNTMEIVAIIFVIAILIYIAIKFITKKKYPYEKRMLLTKTEYAFYKILKAECDKRGYLICPKVRMEDFLYVTNEKEKAKYRGYVKSRHIDFIICDSELYMLCGIELDDPSHDSKKAQKIDRFKDDVFETIGVPLYRIKVVDGNYREQLNKAFKNLKKSSW